MPDTYIKTTLASVGAIDQIIKDLGQSRHKALKLFAAALLSKHGSAETAVREAERLGGNDLGCDVEQALGGQESRVFERPWLAWVQG
ncbi:hypothetical protein [Novosphingobium sp. JCM 18896]|uniref:hypothetical protein n=1 Tax=Novosphingobium sp. JCM 18896 TaxID=2989731 RepID=UPI002221F87C|nr:hypothetical protein [Novosphingobium sp. JCM 18896]MCW1431881.1 hypothetical protein [Novosphingobium sp. JCM 18896]